MGRVGREEDEEEFNGIFERARRFLTRWEQVAVAYCSASPAPEGGRFVYDLKC